jgi:hypothetical protein
MALTNIELYEALKKDLSEDSARMIAEVFPRAADLATKSDIAELKSYIDSRLLRYTAMIVMPTILTMLTTVIAVVIKL